MKRFPVKIISAQEFIGGGEDGPFPVEQFQSRCLAQGDSWFSIGAVPFFLTTNLLQELELRVGTCVVNCASPSATLKRMIDTTRSTTFLQLLSGALATKWDAVLVSGGGNDLIEALQSRSPDAGRRLLRFPAEWGDPGSAARYISEAGWLTFCDHIREVFRLLVQARDAGPKNRGTPIVFHSYDLPAPRNAPAGPGFGPWLSTALGVFDIPGDDWDAVAGEIYSRLQALLREIRDAHEDLVLVDSLGTLTRAENTDEGATEDWQNEIHPTREGYAKLDQKWVPVLEQVLTRTP
jgi:lysophospholipase L1-like esterase